MAHQNRNLTHILGEISSDFLIALFANLGLHFLYIGLNVYYPTPIAPAEIQIAALTAVIVAAYSQARRYWRP